MADEPSVSGVITSGSDPSPAAPPAAQPDSTGSAPAAALPGTASGTDPQPSGDSATPNLGPIPYDRFKQVNTRMQEAERRVKEMQDTYGDVIALPAERARFVAQLSRQLEQDPVTTAIQLSEWLMRHPQYGPQMTSQAARMLQSRRGQNVPQETPEPEPDLVAENGAPVYSASRLKEWRQWADRQTEARILQRIAPLERDAQTRQQEQRMAAVRQKADTEAGALLEKAKSWHGFEAHQESIMAAFKEHPDWALQDAYLHVLHTEILPALPAQAQATVVAQLQQKAAAQTMNPAGGSPATKPDFGGDFTKALKFFDAKK